MSRGRWRPAKHLLRTSKRLVDLAARRIKRLIVAEPPRHGKSELISKYFPVWYLGLFPDHRIILTSYESDFAASWGRKARDIVEEHGDLFGIRLRRDSTAGNRWELDGHGGGMSTAGAGASITGKGGNLIIIDDPFKNAEEANSKTIRDKVWDWYQSTLYTRLEPGGVLVIVMTRWHEDDLVGRLLNPEYGAVEDWTQINFPAIAEENDVLGRQPGEPLWPERYGLEELERIRETVGSYWWNALYQQRPQPMGGGMFKRKYFRYFRDEPEFFVLRKPDGERRIEKSLCRIIQTVDLAASTKTSADYFVIETWAITPEKDLLLVDTLHERVEGPDQLPLLWQAYQKWRPAYQLVENVAYQLAFIQTARREGLPVRATRPDRDKVSRALPLSARYEGGSVYHRVGASWLSAYEDELLAFPHGAHDDQVDCAAYACMELVRGPIGPVAKPKGW